MSLPPNVITMPALPHKLLIDNMVERARYPRRIAARFMDSPQLVLESTIFYYDCIEADNGDREAKARVDHVRESVEQMREAEKALGNDPDIGPRGPVVGRIGRLEPVTRRGATGPLAGPPVPSKGELRRLSERKGPRPERPKIILP